MHFAPPNLLAVLWAFCAYEIETLAVRYGVRREKLQRLRDAVRGPTPVARGEILYRQGLKAGAIFAVARGSFKTSSIDRQGRPSLSELYFEGDFLGLEALGDATHNSTAEALEPSTVFRLSVPNLRTAIVDVPGLEKELLLLMSKEICRREEHRLLLHKKTAATKLASFLLYLSERGGNDKERPDYIKLGMRRQDVAAYLGLTTETVSRLLTRFARHSLIDVAQRHIKLRNLKAISQFAKGRTLWVAAATLVTSSLFF